jgi:hypothetical protein
MSQIGEDKPGKAAIEHTLWIVYFAVTKEMNYRAIRCSHT